MNVQVLISTHNGANWIEKCIDSLLRSTIPVKIKLIDNLSTDATVQIVKAKYPQIDYMINTEDMGFAKANNILLRQALADNVDYVFLLNQDAWVDPGTIEGLINVHEQHPEYGIISPIHLNGEGKAFDYKFALYCSEKSCPGLNSDLYLNKVRDIYDINFVNGAFWLISKECLKSVGLFDPLFYVYFEDIDFISRLKYKGFKVGIAPQFVGYHDRINNPPEPSQQKTRYMMRLKYISLIKNINRSFIMAYLSFLKLYFKNVFTALSHLDFGSFIHEIKIGFELLFSINKIIKSREECKNNGSYIFESPQPIEENLIMAQTAS